MIEKLEALAALRTAGTTGRAAVLLRITQSAVSKRVAALEAETGQKLIEQQGRNVKLTAAGEHLLEGALPLIASLRDLLRENARRSEQVVKIAATDSLLASWLPEVLRGAVEQVPGLTLELHAHRGPMLLQRVRAGEYALGLCPGASSDKELAARELVQEPMVIVPARCAPLARSDVVPVWTIETQSLTWEALARRIARARKTLGFGIEVQARLESFTGLVQIARAGFGNALVPLGVARELGVPLESLVRLPGLSRSISLVARKAVHERRLVRALTAELALLAQARFPPGRD